MRIGIDIRNIGKKRTGDEVVFFNLVKNLALIDSKNEYRLLTDITDEEVIKDIEQRLGIVDKNNFRIIPLKTKNKFTWNIWTLPNYLRFQPVDIYQTQYITPFFVSRQVKIVTVIHDISFVFYPQFIKLSDLFFLRALIPLSLRRADKILAVSEFTEREILSYYGIERKKVDYVHNAVSEDFLNSRYSQEELEKIRQKYGLPERFILYMGTMQPRKNLPMLIEGFSRIKDEITGSKLVLAGNRSGHNFDARIDKIIAELDLQKEVIFPGYVADADKAAVYKLARVCCFPALYEGFGIPVLEAMSQGVPVAASNIDGLREATGSAALLFNPRDLDDLSKKLYTCFVDENIRKNLIREAAQKVGFFSWKKTAQKTLEIYENI